MEEDITLLGFCFNFPCRNLKDAPVELHDENSNTNLEDEKPDPQSLVGENGQNSKQSSGKRLDIETIRKDIAFLVPELQKNFKSDAYVVKSNGDGKIIIREDRENSNPVITITLERWVSGKDGLDTSGAFFVTGRVGPDAISRVRNRVAALLEPRRKYSDIGAINAWLDDQGVKE